MAKDPKADVKPPEDPVVVESTPSKGIPRLYILIGLASLVLLQVLLLFFLLPSPGKVRDEVEKAGQTEIDRSKGEYTQVPLPEDTSVKIETIEKPLGEKFRVQDVNKADPTKMDGFSGSVYAVIKKTDEAAFDALYTKNEKRVRSLIQTILRESSVEERTEPSLSVIRGRIKRRVREELGIPFVLDIGCNDVQTENM